MAGDGDDLLRVGAGDHATGHGGADTFALSDWVEGDPPATIADFDTEQDELVVVYDPALHPDPRLTLEPSPDGDGVRVMLDGVVLAEVPGASDLQLEDIRLTTLTQLAA